MALSFAFLPKSSHSISAIFQKPATRETKFATINVASTPSSSEFNTSHETNSTKTLYSTPLTKSFATDSYNPFTEYELEHRVEKVREIIAMVSRKEEWLEELIMIDSIQRLGIEHYFKKEIHSVLQRHFKRFCTLEKCCGDDLHEVALRFRLLRQQGYNVTVTDTFGKFMDQKGVFRQELLQDRKGLISLFEASHSSIEGEDNLDEAKEFSALLLKTSFNDVQDLKDTIIATTLSNPYLRSLPRIMAKNFICNLEMYLKLFHNFEDRKHGWINEVRDLARMDFNIAQITHQSEIAQVYNWWKKLDLNKELKLARDQPVKWHTWSLAAFSNPSKKEERIDLTKVISLIYIIDDIFDIYGTLQELTLFTEAVNRWELFEDIEGLPNSMKMCLKALHDTTDELSHKIHSKHGCNPKTSFQKAWADLCNAYLVEGKWLASDYLPSSEEYLKNAVVTVAAHVAVVHIFYLMGREINNKTIQHLNSFPDLVSSMATIIRLSDDLGINKEENDRNGYDLSYIDYYNNEHNEKFVDRLISEAWKSLNEICILSPSPFSPDFRAACFNMTRMAPMMYNYDNHHCLPSLEKHMKSLLYESLN